MNFEELMAKAITETIKQGKPSIWDGDTCAYQYKKALVLERRCNALAGRR